VLPGSKVPRLPGARVLYRDGIALAVLVAGNVELLTALSPQEERDVRRTLLREPEPQFSPSVTAGIES
jgi:ATP-dependent Lhr-like helicase